MLAQNRASDGGSSAVGTEAPCDRSAEIAAAIASLHTAHAQHIDPVGFRHVEALARRTEARSGAVRVILDHKLASAIAACRARCERAAGAMAGTVASLAQRFPQAGTEVDKLHAEADAQGLHRLEVWLEAEARKNRGPLAVLTDELDRLTAATSGNPKAATATTSAAPGSELRALRDARDAWSQLNVDRQLSRSIAKRPDNPGPLNSHLLVLRALQSMQKISPAYLQGFISHVETLWWLDQATFGIASAPTKVGRRDGEKKRTATRNRAR